ncbi:NAD(P)-binding protein [Chloroflexia bacterium SDU3-3]|nr:NAD(P)-binding protein [Chloroflexia bacterium SDU3-3]
MTSITILGGGVAGLTAAVQLAERGLRPLLLEAEPEQIGGRLRDTPPVTVEHAGEAWSFPAEHGVHGIWSPYRNLLALLERHGITPDMAPSREETWIYGEGRSVRMAHIGSAIRGSWVPAPFHYLALFLRPSFLAMLTPADIVSMFAVEGSLIGVMAIDPLAEGKSLAGMTLADLTRGWSPRIRSLFAGLARNALAAHPEQAPAAGFIAFLRFYTLLRRDAWGFHYLRGTGGGGISGPLAAKARELGVEIRLGSRATRLERAGQGWRVTYERGGQEHAVESEQVVLALDSPSAARLLRDSPPTAAQAADMVFPAGVPTVIMRFWYDTTPKGAVAETGICTGDFLVDNFFWLHRLQPAYQAWHEATGGSAVEAHIYGPQEIADRPDGALLAQTSFDMARAFPELRDRMIHCTIDRNPATHTLFTPGAPERSLAVRTPWPGLVACGDWVFDPNPALYLERATTTGMLAANAVLEACGLEPWPLLPHPSPEPLAGAMARGLQRLRHAMLRRRARGKE